MSAHARSSEVPGPRLLGLHHGQHLAPARVKLLALLPLLVSWPTGVKLVLSEKCWYVNYVRMSV